MSPFPKILTILLPDSISYPNKQARGVWGGVGRLCIHREEWHEIVHKEDLHECKGVRARVNACVCVRVFMSWVVATANEQKYRYTLVVAEA